MTPPPLNESKCCPSCQGGPASRSFCVNTSCSCHKEKCCEKCQGKDMFSGETFCTQEAHGIPCDCHYPINTGDVGGGAGAPDFRFHPTNKEWKFMECDTCRPKPGSPTLCNGCLHNRAVIDKLHSEREKAHEEGRQALRDELCKKLEKRKVLVTLNYLSNLKQSEIDKAHNAAIDKAIEIGRGKG